jgi:uncharacterized membrane protein YfcA
MPTRPGRGRAAGHDDHRLGHWWLGTINLLLLLSLLTGSIPGIVAGSDLTRFTPEGVLRPLLAAVLLLVAIKLLF